MNKDQDETKNMIADNKENIENKEEKNHKNKKNHNKDNEYEVIDEFLLEQSKNSNLIQDNYNVQLLLKNKKTKIKVPDLRLAKRYESDPKIGLNSEQVNERIVEGFINISHRTKTKSYKKIFFDNIVTLFNIIIFIVAIALLYVRASATQFVFFGIIVINISIGIYQECKAKKIIMKLTLFTAPSACVIRNGKKQNIPCENVVLDDILLVDAGKQIISDCIVSEGTVYVNESMLTGESEAVKKVKGDRMYSGSFVTSGACSARVDKISRFNYIETITEKVINYKQSKSELYESMKKIVQVITIFLIPITIFLLLNNYSTTGATSSNNVLYNTITKSSGAIIGMLPSGMFLLISVTLAVGLRRLSAKKALVQDLFSIEMLARVNVLCLDKTGTLTDGSMVVKNVELMEEDIKESNIARIIGTILFNTKDNNQTAMALANYFGYYNETAKVIMPFTSDIKMSGITTESNETYLIGAPEFVLKEKYNKFKEIVNTHAQKGERVLILAESEKPIQIEEDKFKRPIVNKILAIIIIQDNIREDAESTIQWFKDNDVKIKIISGDNPVTVSAIAKKVGVANADRYISLEKLSNQEVIEDANKYTVFGRVNPEQKALLVKTIKAEGNTVAMTGDGVNDILALRAADCSIAMASGAEAARNVSRIVLLNNNFSSMPDVVMEGRRAVNNTQKSASLYLMKTFMAISLSLITLLLKMPYPFTTNNSLLLEFCVIGVPSIILAFVVNKNRIQGKFIINVLSRSAPGGIALTCSVFAMKLFCYLEKISDYTCNTMSILAITFVGLMVLYRICEPFDKLKGFMMFFVALVCIVAILLVPSLFGIDLKAIDTLDLLFVIVVALASYFFLSIITVILTKLKLYY